MAGLLKMSKLIENPVKYQVHAVIQFLYTWKSDTIFVSEAYIYFQITEVYGKNVMSDSKV